MRWKTNLRQKASTSGLSTSRFFATSSTEDELALIKAREDQQLADAQEREQKNTEYQNLLSSVNDIILALAEKEGTTSDLENQINDINLVLADLIGE